MWNMLCNSQFSVDVKLSNLIIFRDNFITSFHTENVTPYNFFDYG